MKANDLKTMLDVALVGTLAENHQNLKDAIDNLLIKGATKKEILRFVRQKAGGKRNGITVQMVSAYLDAK